MHVTTKSNNHLTKTIIPSPFDNNDDGNGKTKINGWVKDSKDTNTSAPNKNEVTLKYNLQYATFSK